MAVLIGDQTSSYAVSDGETGGTIAAFQFTALKTGRVDTLWFHAAAGQGGPYTLTLGLLADSAGAPGAVIDQGSVGPTSVAGDWVKVTGLNASVVAGTVYWLAVVESIGGPGITFDLAVASGGTTLRLSTDALNTSTTIDAAGWGGTFAEGPTGFYGESTVPVTVDVPAPMPVTSGWQ